MMTDEQTGLRVGDEPNLKEMQAALEQACQDASDRITKLTRDENTRFAKWSGQRNDGRLGDKTKSGPALPWPGASDTRIMLADSIISDQVKLMKAAVRHARVQVIGTESSDMAGAGKVQLYLDYLRYTRMRASLKRETELAAQWRQTHGRAVMAVTWDQKWSRAFDTVTLQELQDMASIGSMPAATIVGALHEPDRDVQRQLALVLSSIYPDLDRGEAYKQLRNLRTTGTMTLPVRSLVVNEPRWTALKPWVDVFYPLNTEDAQTADWIAWRRVFTRSAVLEKQVSEGWSEAFVTALLATAGSSVISEVEQSKARSEVFESTTEEMKDLIEVFYFYHTVSDSKGVPCRYCTVMSPNVAPDDGEYPHGPDGPLGYEHGLMPFVFLRRELPDRLVEDGRGVAEIVSTSQGEVKTLRDTRINQTELYLQPPTIRPEREIGLPLKIKPRGEIGEKRANTTRRWEVQNTAPAAEPLEAAVLRDVERYWGRDRATDPVRVGLHEEDLSADWCDELLECWAMTLKLAQQFESTLRFSRIVGTKMVAINVSREEIQGAYDLKLNFNPDTLDPDRMKAKADLAKNVMQPMDRWGVYNWRPWLAGLAEVYFPEVADQMVQSVEQASESEVKDEQQAWALMMAGEEPQMVERGQNFALRLEWLKNKLQQPAAQARLNALPDTRELVERRLKYFEFQLGQQNNADTGRMGVPPLPASGAAA